MAQNLFRRFTKKFFIVSNIILGVLFLLGSYAYLFNPKYFWFLGLLTLGSFYLLLLLIISLIFWLFIKRKWALISFITMLLAYKPITNLFPLRFTASFDTKKAPASLRILSWNVEHFAILEHKTHPETKQQMIDLINQYQPDIACFQEMVGSDRNPAAINYVPDMMEKLDFDDYSYSFNPKLDFDGDHHFGTIIFSKLPIINKQMVSYYPNDYNSIFQYIDVLKGQDTIRVFNIHLQSLKFSQSNLQYLDKPSVESENDIEKSKSIVSKLKTGFLKRKLQAERIKEEMSKSPYPLIVCGDFNDVPNSYAYHTIGKDLKNAFVEKGSGIGRTFSGISPTLRIDNIFTSPAFDILQYTRIAKKLSDHFPVFADLEMKK